MSKVMKYLAEAIVSAVRELFEENELVASLGSEAVFDEEASEAMMETMCMIVDIVKEENM